MESISVSLKEFAEKVRKILMLILKTYIGATLEEFAWMSGRFLILS